MTPLRWGIVATIRASAFDTLAFAAHHIALGAHRIYIYLDDEKDISFRYLKEHPKVRVTTCDAGYWTRHHKQRPDRHQVRQTANATHAYARRAEVDWLGHIDVDEFLLPDTPLHECLAGVPADVAAARVRPLEALAPTDGASDGPTAFKATPIDRTERRRATTTLYPEYAKRIDDGFLSHVAGKLFVRTGLDDVEFRIHRAFSNGTEVPQVELAAVRLLHLHAESWQDWRARFDYRLERGAYRAELGRAGPSGQTLHEVLADIQTRDGDSGLREFYDTLFAATPQHVAALDAAGLLFHHHLRRSELVEKHFPDFRANC